MSTPLVQCTLPWTEMFIEWRGVTACCYLGGSPKYCIKTEPWAAWDNLDEIVSKGTELTRIRRDMLDAGKSGKDCCGIIGCPRRVDIPTEGLTPSSGLQLQHVGITVTARCQARCHYCPQWHVGNRPTPDQPTLKQVQNVTTSLANLHLQSVFLGGGDPLALDDDQLDLYMALSHKCRVALMTNGIGLTKPRWDKWFRNNRNVSARITLDTMDPKIYAKTRGPYADKIHEQLRDVLTGQDLSNVGISCTVSRANLDDIVNVMQFAHDLKIGCFTLNAVCVTTKLAPKMNLLGADTDIQTCLMVQEYLQKWQSLARQWKLPLRGVDRFVKATANRLAQLRDGKPGGVA